MNKKIYNEDLVLNLIVNGDKITPGNKKLLTELNELDQAMRKLQLANAKLELDRRALSKSDANYAEKLKLIENQMKANDRQMDSYRARMMELRKEIGVAGMTINQLNTYLKVLQTQLRNATDPTVVKGLRKEIEQVQTRITTLTTGAGRLSQAWAQLARDANKYSAAIGWISVIVYGISNAVGNLIDRLTGLDRKLSEVMKTTGMTREEAARLKREFDLASTPTKTDDLLAMAKIAGRLGIEGFDNIKRFTSAVDVLYTALGDDLNLSVEDTAEKVGKLVNAFRVTDKMPIDEALLRTGSLLNQLDKSSVASAGTILEYMTRLSSLGTTANYPMEKLAGLAAALETVNIPAERGSTALRNIIDGLGKHADKFSRIMGITLEEYKRQVETDINGVFLKLIELTSKGDKSIMDTVQSMGDFEISGVRVAEVFGALAKNLDVVRTQQDIATESFKSSASVMSEWNIIVQDYMGTTQAQEKRVRFLSDEFNLKLKPAVTAVYNAWIDFLYGIRQFFKDVYEYQNILKGLVALFVVWKAAIVGTWMRRFYEEIVLQVLILKENYKAMVLNNAIMIAWRENGIKGVILELRKLFVLALSNPWTATITVLGALAASFYFLKGKIDQVDEAMANMVNDMANQKNEMNRMFDLVEKTAIGTEKHDLAVKSLNETYNKYLPNLISEKDGIEEVAKAREKAIKLLEQEILMKHENDAFAKIQEDYAIKRTEESGKLLDNMSPTQKGMGARGLADIYSTMISEQEQGSIDRKTPEELKQHWLDLMGITITHSDDDVIGRALDNYIRFIEDEMAAKARLSAYKRGYFMPESKKAIEEEGKKDKTKPSMSEKEFKDQQEAYEVAYKEQLIALRNSISDKDQLRKAELKAEMGYTDNLIANQLNYNKDNKAALTDLKLKKSELQQQMEELGIKEVKAQEKVEKKLLDMEKIRIEAMVEGRDKELMQEQKRYNDLITEYENSGAERSKIDEAIELATQDHVNKLYDINLKYNDKELENNTISFAERMALLELLYQTGEIKEADYLDRKKKLQDDYQKALVQWNKKNGDIDTEAMNAEIRNAIIQGQLLCATEEDIQKAIDAIKKKYAKKQERDAETNAQRILRIEKEKLTDEQKLLWAKGESAIRYAEMIGQGVGNAFGAMFDKSQKANEAFLKGLLETVLQAAHTLVAEWYPVILARNIANQGPAGVATTALEIGLIEAAFAVAKSALSQWNTSKDTSSTTTQHAKGKYPVIGADDGQTYWASWTGNAQTGIYTQPSLIAEKGPEMVIDYPTLRNIKMNAPGLIDTILQMRVPQYAIGKYSDGGYAGSNNLGSQTPIQIIQQGATYQRDPELTEAINTMTRASALLMKNGVQLSIVALKKRLDEVEDILNQTGMPGFE